MKHKKYTNRAPRHTGNNTFQAFLKRCTEPVDPETFKYALRIWSHAAMLTMPVRNPEEQKVRDPVSGDVYSMSDIPQNRAAVAVTDELRSMGVANRQAYLMRVMQLHQVLNERKGRLTQYFDENEKGETKIANSLIEAMATARFIFKTPEDAEFDIDDIIAKAAIADQRMKEGSHEAN